MSSDINTLETMTAPITMAHSLANSRLLFPSAGEALLGSALTILRRNEDQDELDAWRQLCLTSMHSGSELETFETISSFKMSGRQDDVEPELDARSCWLMTTREHHILREPLMISRGRPWCQAFLVQVTRLVMRYVTTRRTIPLNVRNDKSDGIEPTPM